jgi:hypothetical protein
MNGGKAASLMPTGNQPAHSCPSACACSNTNLTASSCWSGGYLYFLRMRLTINRS